MQQLAADRGTSELLLRRMAEFTEKLCYYATQDSITRLRTDEAEMLERFRSLSRDVDAALEDLTGRLATSSKYQNCANDVQMWLTRVESDVAETVLKIQLRQDYAVHVEHLQALLMELERHRVKLDDLDQLEKCCGTAEAQHLCDELHDRYENLTNDVKVCCCLLYSVC